MKYGMKTRGILTVVLLALLMAGSACSAVAPSAEGKPNVILIMTDDMDFSLMPHMKYTNELIVQEGAAFPNYFVTSPLCCPSRTSLIRGQYPHNTNILENARGSGISSATAGRRKR
jgi:N-acetylglucosamine-6-sulfatase